MLIIEQIQQTSRFKVADDCHWRSFAVVAAAVAWLFVGDISIAWAAAESGGVWGKESYVSGRESESVNEWFREQAFGKIRCLCFPFKSYAPEIW